jgi:hypothetical protein
MKNNYHHLTFVQYKKSSINKKKLHKEIQLNLKLHRKKKY